MFAQKEHARAKSPQLAWRGWGWGVGETEQRDDVTGQAARSHGAVLVMVNLAFTPGERNHRKVFEQKNDMI